MSKIRKLPKSAWSLVAGNLYSSYFWSSGQDADKWSHKPLAACKKWCCKDWAAPIEEIDTSLSFFSMTNDRMKGINCFQYDRERLTLYAFQFHSWSVISDRIRKISWNFIRVGSGSIEWLKLIDSVGHSWGLAHTGWWITNIVIEIEHFTNLIVFFKEMRRYFSIWRWRLWFKRRNCGSSYYFYTPVQGSFKKRREAEQGRVWYKHAVMINYIQGPTT